MSEFDLNKIRLLYELISEVENFKNKESIDNIKFDNLFNIMLPDAKDGFEKHNNFVFNINLYIIIRLFKNEFIEFRKKHDKIGIEEYYDFIETLNLPLIISEIYIKMPQMLENRRILSYITDMPSFMGIIKD